MQISARIFNREQQNELVVDTDGNSKKLSIPSKTAGKGSSVNGGELLFAALATCACNDIYREAAKRNLNIHAVEVEVDGEFGKEGEPGRKIKYSIKITAPELTPEEINELITRTDDLVEIHNTLRAGADVQLVR